MALHNTIATRFLGAASLIKLKTPEEGFQMERRLLQNVREGTVEKHVKKVYSLSREQLAVYQAGTWSYVNFGGHGTGKSKSIQIL